MNQTDRTSILDFYNMLLEAERAGVKVIGVGMHYVSSVLR